MTCRICQRRGIFTMLTNTPLFWRKAEIVCDTGTGFQHIVRGGEHFILNTNHDEDETTAPIQQLEHVS